MVEGRKQIDLVVVKHRGRMEDTPPRIYGVGRWRPRSPPGTVWWYPRLLVCTNGP